MSKSLQIKDIFNNNFVKKNFISTYKMKKDIFFSIELLRIIPWLILLELKMSRTAS